MKVAFAFLEGRIAPVFDTSRRLHIAEMHESKILSETEEAMDGELPMERVKRLVDLGIGTLVCGAISAPIQQILVAQGIQVIPFVAGDLREVVSTLLQGDLNRGSHRMPGCRGHGLGGINREGRAMTGKGRMGCAQGTGPRRSQRGAGGPPKGGRPDECVCPKCGHREVHKRGMPCNQKVCPECGTAMTRE